MFFWAGFAVPTYDRGLASQGPFYVYLVLIPVHLLTVKGVGTFFFRSKGKDACVQCFGNVQPCAKGVKGVTRSDGKMRAV